MASQYSSRVLGLEHDMDNLLTVINSFSKLVNLETLAMSENEDMSEIPESVCSLISLKKLDIDNCGLKKLPAR